MLLKFNWFSKLAFMIYSFDESQRYNTFYLMLYTLWVKINILHQKNLLKNLLMMFLYVKLYLIYHISVKITIRKIKNFDQLFVVVNCYEILILPFIFQDIFWIYFCIYYLIFLFDRNVYHWMDISRKHLRTSDKT